MAKECKDCWHNYHCPVPQTGEDHDPDNCPYIEGFDSTKIRKDEFRNYDRKALYEMRDNIMDNFDFRKVAQVMDFLDWGWASGTNGELFVPDESDIRREARMLLDDIIERFGTSESCSCIDTGGFRVELTEYDGLPDLRLSFVIDDWTEGGECWDEYQKNIDNRKQNGRFKPLKK